MVVHFLITFSIVLLNILPLGAKLRKNIILPFSFIVLFVYWAIRYEYGQDYWHYYDIFYGNMVMTDYGTGDVLFFMFFNPLFDRYWQAIVGQSAFIMITLYVFARKYIPTNSYWLFFLLFLATGGFHFSLISALRSSLAAGIMYWGFSLAVIDKNRPLLYCVFVVIASLFHTSALVLLIFPIIKYVIIRMNTKTILILLFFSNVFAMFVGNLVFNILTSYFSSYFSFLEYYDHYSEQIGNIGWSDFLLKCVYFLPLYYVCRYYNKTTDERFKNAYVLTIFFFFINFLNMDFHARFTAYLFIFFVMSLCNVYKVSLRRTKFLILGPYIVVVFVWLGFFYYQVFSLRNSVYINGNFDVYKTIFDSHSFP